MDRGLLDNLKEILQERISFSESVRNNHAKGEDAYDPILPRAVLFPKNNEELSKIRSFLPQHRNISFPFSVKEVILMGRYPYNHKTDKSHNLGITLKELMFYFDIFNLKDASYNKLSGGESSRVEATGDFHVGALSGNIIGVNLQTAELNFEANFTDVLVYDNDVDINQDEVEIPSFSLLDL